MAGIAILLGAGAAHDCADTTLSQVDGQLRPPLVGDLFTNIPTFNDILRKYPKAEALSARVRTGVSAGTNLEDILRELANASQPEIRRMYFQIPLYLQELLGVISSGYVKAGDTRFDMLATDLVQANYDNILYLTVNYDLFIERALSKVYDVHFNDISDYCKEGRKWALVKLHGSITWGNPANNVVLSRRHAVLPDLDGDTISLGDEIRVLSGYEGSHRIPEGVFHYPHLAVPLGGKEDFMCPKDHLQQMQRRLADCQTLLIIGFSGLDTHVVNLIRRNYKYILIVNGTHAEGRKTVQRFAEQWQGWSVAPEDIIFKGGFAQFVSSGEMSRFINVHARHD